jgi:zinc D-Ala-D-Ala carboxypeptidase
MAKNRRLLAILVLAVVALAALIFIVFTVSQSRRAIDKPTPVPQPVQIPQIEPPKIEPPKPKQPPKPKETVKPPKTAAVEEDVLGKVRLCPASSERASIASDGRLLGHHPYPQANPTDLGSSPEGFNNGSCSQLHGEAKVALDQLMGAARAADPTIADAMIGLSCFRSITYQREVFCRKVSDGFAVRARASAPPGFSEHATGYAIDFGDRNNPQCNLSNCFSTTPVGEWLAANAGQYGFVLSFPKSNSQGVMYEPWHWRYQGSPAAQTVFADAN